MHSPGSDEPVLEGFGARHVDEARQLLRAAEIERTALVGLEGPPVERIAQLREIACQKGTERIATATLPMVVAAHIQRHPESRAKYDLSMLAAEEARLIEETPDELLHRARALDADWQIVRVACGWSERGELPARYHDATAQLTYLLSDTAGLVISGNKAAATRLTELAGGRLPDP